MKNSKFRKIGFSPNNPLSELEMATPKISVIVPAFNAAGTLGRVLDGLVETGFRVNQITVVDDGSTDATQEIARAFGVQLLLNKTSKGAASARNFGAGKTDSDLLLFVDSDVVVHRDVRQSVLDWERQYPSEAAVFGSYDAEPADQRRVSRIRNLLHHHTHQIAPQFATTFWTGLGAVRRLHFDAVGGFDPQQFYMEDVAFGHALKMAGCTIRLDRDLQGTHLKYWSLFGFMRTDLLHRAIPWVRLIKTSAAPRSLNADQRGVASVLSVLSTLVSLGAATFFASIGIVLLGISLGLLAFLNRDFLRFLYAKNGLAELFFGLAILWLHFLIAGLGAVWVLVFR